MKTTLKSLALGVSIVAIPASLTAFSATAAEGLKMEGFVDAQLFGNSSSNLTQGFVVNDGAVYISKDVENAEFRLDAPFSFSGAGADFTFGKNKFQAFVGFKYPFGLRWRLGQFDTIYGFEQRDTADVQFSRQGLLYSMAIPNVHTGLLLGYDMGPGLKVNVLVANPHDNAMLNRKNPEFGAQIMFAPDAFRLAAGVLTNKNSATNESSMLIDVIAGTKVADVGIDLEFVSAKPATAGAESGMGLLGNFSYGLTDMIAAGARVEYANKMSNATLQTGYTTVGTKQLQATVGPQFSMTKDFKVKVDYTYLKDTAADDTSVSNHSYALSGVYKF